MRKLLIYGFMIISLFACEDNQEIETTESIKNSEFEELSNNMSSSVYSQPNYRLSQEFYDNVESLDVGQNACPQTNSYTVQLKTMTGQNIAAANVLPNTQYRIVISYSGSYVCCRNVAYCTVLAYGFTGGANDSTNGSTTITIRTDATLPPFGIIGVVGPTDCSGSCVSAQNSTATQKEIS